MQLTQHSFDTLETSDVSKKSDDFDPKNGLVGSRTGAANDAVEGSSTPEIATAHSQNCTSWDLIGKYRRFVPIAEAFAQMSKMPGTHVGCVILGEARQVLASGWNGAPRGSRADTDQRSDTRESRLDWVVHAEANAIANAARSGTALDGGALLCTLMPCMTCAKLIVQAGIEVVLCPPPTDGPWKGQHDLALALFHECGIDIFYYDSTGIKE